MKTIEKLKLIENYKLITDIYEKDYQCHCGNLLNMIVQAKGFANSRIDSETLAYLCELALRNNWRIASNI